MTYLSAFRYFVGRSLYLCNRETTGRLLFISHIISVVENMFSLEVDEMYLLCKAATDHGNVVSDKTDGDAEI